MSLSSNLIISKIISVFQQHAHVCCGIHYGAVGLEHLSSFPTGAFSVVVNFNSHEILHPISCYWGDMELTGWWLKAAHGQSLTPVGSGPSSVLLPTQPLHLLEDSPNISTSKTGCAMPVILSKSLQDVSAWESAVVGVPGNAVF